MVNTLTIFLFLSTFLVFISADSFRVDLVKVLQLGSYESNISLTCGEQLKLLGSNLGSLNHETEWAWKMVDAMAKLQSGILVGNNAELGAFDECIDIQKNTSVEIIRGKYCLGTLLLKMSSYFEKESMKINTEDILSLTKSLQYDDTDSNLLSLFWGSCIPDGCTGEEVSSVYNDFLNNYLDGIVTFHLSEDLCQTSDDVHAKLDEEAVIGLVIFAIILGFMIFSTLYDIYLRYYNSEQTNTIWLSFSVLTNGKKLFKINKNNPDLLPCLNGIRVISMLWVILGHQYSTMTSMVLANGLKVMEWLDSLHSMYISNATLAVDTFFLLAGLLMAYGFFNALEKGIRFNIFMFWVHRYLRLTPALAALILLNATVQKYLGSGPFWPLALASESCKKYWWSTILYIQNWVNVDEWCLGHSWYLSIDMQLFILSPLVLIPMSKWKKLGLGLLSLLILISIAIPFAVAWINDLHVMTDFSVDVQIFMQKYYSMTYTRATPWLIGILLGYYIVHMKKSVFKPSKMVVCFLWAASLSLIITCVFSGHSLHDGTEYNKLAHVSYITFMRPTWSIAVSWIILACITGYGGPINSFLSLPIYQVLGRLTYSMYLLHVVVLSVKMMSLRMPNYFSDAIAMYEMWGTTIFTAAFSIIWVLAFESPMITIEKVLFHKSDKQKIENKISKNNSNLNNC